jgi:hypothetical protein
MPLRPRRGTRRRVAVLALLFVVLLFAIDGIYVTAGLGKTLTRTRDRLDQGAEALRRSNPQAARRAFDEALESAEEAVQLTRHPSLNLLSFSPWAGADATGVIAMARAGELAARGGVAAAGAAARLGLSEDGLAASVYRDGRLDLEALSAAAPSVAAADDALTDAAELLLGAPQPDIEAFATLLERAQERAVEAQASAHRAHALVDSLPSLLGATTSRRYLLAFQTLSESRGTGGVIGLYGILAAEQGNLELEEVGPYSAVVPRRMKPVDAPDWFVTNYGPQAALTEWPQANVSPNFEVTSQVLLNMYEAATGERLDGVVAMDPVAMAAMLDATGPITAGDGTVIDSTNAVDVLSRDAYVAHPVDDAQQDLFLIQLIRRFWQKIDEGDMDVPLAGEKLAEATRRQHLRVYSVHPDDQEAVRELDADGQFTDYGPNVQMVFHQNYTANKVDYYLDRRIETNVRLRADGGAGVVVTTHLANAAPAAPVTPMNRPNRTGDLPGTNRMFLSFLVPRGAEIGTMSLGGRTFDPLVYEDSGHPVAWSIVEIPPGSQRRVTLRYDMPAAGPTAPFSIVLFPQVMADPDDYSLVVTSDADLVEKQGLEGSGTTARSSGELTEPLTFSTRPR